VSVCVLTLLLWQRVLHTSADSQSMGCFFSRCTLSFSHVAD